MEKRHHKEEKVTVIQPGLDLDAIVKSSKFLNLTPISYNEYDIRYHIPSTLTAIVFFHYRVGTKMALEISRYIMCRVRL